MRPYNLLPEENQQILQWEYARLNALWLSVYILLTLIVISGFLWLGASLLQRTNTSLAAETLINLETQQNTLATGDAQQLNLMIDAFKKRQPFAHDWTNVLIFLSASLPKGVYLQQLSINQTEKTATFTGKAESRTQLLALKDVLEQSPYFSAVALPTSALTQPDQITFSFETTFVTTDHE